MIGPRDDLALMAGYHSPQVEVSVRLNTNESPYAPPDEFVTRYTSALAAVDWHRYPDRGAHVRGSSDGTSARWTRSVVIVGRPAAKARSHGPDISRAVGQRRLIDTSQAAMWSINSRSSGR